MAETATGAGNSSATDAELIAAARSGDSTAFGTLYERHSAAAQRLAWQIVKRQADVDDVVAETFARVLSALQRGIGPAEAFRPYLLTAVRRVAIDVLRGQHHQVPTDESELPDPGEPFDDPVVAGLDRSLIAEAFLSLPERWSAVLWHTEVEQAKPSEVASLLGVSANSVAALRYRAREGLRQAYLQLHLSGRADVACRPVASRLGAYVRGRLSTKSARDVAEHLCGCATCSSAYADLTAINDALRGVLAPVVLGGAAASYLAGAGHGAAAAAAQSAISQGAAQTAATQGAAAHGPATQGAAAHGAATQGAAAHGAATQGAAAHGAAQDALAQPGAGHGVAAMIARHTAGVGRLARLATQRPAAPITAAIAAVSIAVPTLVLVHPQPHSANAAPPATISRSHHQVPGLVPPGGRTKRATPTPSASPEPTASPHPSAPGKPGKPGKPAPTTSPSRPTRPSPSNSASPSTSPTSSPTTAPSPSPTPIISATVAATAKLSVGLQVQGLLNLGVTAVVSVDVSDTGNAGTGPLTATLTLPGGTVMLGLSGSSSWSCNASGSSCSHAAIGAGVAADFSFSMLVVSLSGCGSSVLATVASGAVSGSGSSPQQVQCSGGLLGNRAPGLLDLVGVGNRH